MIKPFSSTLAKVRELMIELSIHLVHFSFLFMSLFWENLYLKEYFNFTSFIFIMTCIRIEYLFKCCEIIQKIIKFLSSCNSQDKNNKRETSKEMKVSDNSNDSSNNLRRRNIKKSSKKETKNLS